MLITRQVNVRLGSTKAEKLNASGCFLLCSRKRTLRNAVGIGLRIKTILLNSINVIWAVQSCLQKYSASRLPQITSRTLAIPSHTEGRFAIVTDVGGGMRWTQAALKTRARTCGRQSRVVLTPRRWRQVLEKRASQG